MNKHSPSAEPGPSVAVSQRRCDEPPVSPEISLKPGVMAQRGVQETTLTPAAHAWLANLPPRYQPMVTARRHPHIVNRFSTLWQLRGPLCAYFHELLLSTRKGRTGFSLGVLTELTDLQTLLQDVVQDGALPACVDGGPPSLVYQTKRKSPPACEPISDQRR